MAIPDNALLQAIGLYVQKEFIRYMANVNADLVEKLYGKKPNGPDLWNTVYIYRSAAVAEIADHTALEILWS